MTTFLLVRHAAHDWLGRGVPGRMSGVALNAQGVREAAELAQRLNGRPIHFIYSSPRRRARETAAPLARERGLPVEIESAFDEIDFGDWTGRTYQELDTGHPDWQQWVKHKGAASAPGGESYAVVQDRVLGGIERLRRIHPSETVVVFSHGDVIKAALAGFLGLALDNVERFEIAPASVSVVDTGSDWFQVKQVNGKTA